MATSLHELAALRDAVQRLCQRRDASVWAFYDPEVGGFGLARDPVASSTAASGTPKQVAHLTTTLTALEALDEAPLTDKQIDAVDTTIDNSVIPALSDIRALDDGDDKTPEQAALDLVLRRIAVTRRYVDRALQNPQDWRSDDAAYVYCRVRTLGAAARLLKPNDPVFANNRDNLKRLVAQAWASHEPAPTWGLRESVQDPEATGVDIDDLTTGNDPDAHVPNSFLTYWGLLALSGLQASARPRRWEAKRAAARQWLEKSLALQVAFHFGNSRNADPQQLAWALCGHVNFGDDKKIVAKTTVEYAQLDAGLRAFFAQQLPDGDWPKGQPLFFYKQAGNAYCYIYETLGELLSLATQQGRRFEALRDALRPYFPQLEKLFQLAVHTQQSLTLDDNDAAIGWSSGHNPRRIAPEAWATASVFRFAEALRRLVGAWTNQEAQRLLEARAPIKRLPELRERGGTWNCGRGSAGTQLATGFLNPILQKEARRQRHSAHIPDPDLPVVPDGGARSAVLFGPPGTGKTTLVEAVAGALEWPFIEITPAQFLDKGVEMVSARADEIFRQVMELDRCVVLLDEIDELIQDRGNAEADPVERFFTTTMLPRLAKLWNEQRILFFVNTNDITRVDPAIKRSQRFDTTILVLPPGYQKKIEMLADAKVRADLSEDEVSQQLKGTAPESRKRAEQRRLAWFALLRYDQMLRLAPELSSGTTVNRVSKTQLSEALPKYIEELQTLDWHDDDKTDNDDPPRNISALLSEQRRDPNVRPLARRDDGDGQYTFVPIPPTEDDPEEWAGRQGDVLHPDGSLTTPKK